MKLNLQRPLVFFDIESTGLDIAKDKIIDLSLVKLFPSGEQGIKNFRCNPEKSIPQEASEVHGIYDKDVKDKPTFPQQINEIQEFIAGCDFAGYNIHNFDLPMLVEEFLRAEVDFPPPDAKFIDAAVIFKKKEPRDLTAAYKFYCNKDMEDAHSAEADTLATMEVLLGQFEKYDDLDSDIEKLEQFSRFNEKPVVDFAQKLAYDENGDIVFTFGKYQGKKVKDHIDYARWMYKNDFALDTKNQLRKIFIDHNNN